MKYAIIINPVSGNYPQGFVKQIIQENLTEYKYFETSKEENGAVQARKAIEEGYDFIIACGGDGTVTEVASVLVNSDTKFGIIPAGTGNMLAANLGLPLNIRDSISVIKEGYTRKMDMGKVNDKYFTFMIGCGLNSAIIENTSREKKRKYGYLAYFIEGIKNGLNPPYIRYKIKIDDKKTIRIKALNVVAANKANIIGETFSLAPDASMFDGKMDLIILSIFKNIDYIFAFWKIFTHQHFSKSSRMRRYRFEKAEITSKPKVSVQIDGDILEETPITVKVLPGAINMLVPDKTQTNLMYTVEDNMRKMLNQVYQGFLAQNIKS